MLRSNSRTRRQQTGNREIVKEAKADRESVEHMKVEDGIHQHQTERGVEKGLQWTGIIK